MTSSTTSRILMEVLRRGAVSRAELARRLDLSTPTLTRLAKPLVANGLLRETATDGPARAGRPSRPLRIVPETAQFAGVKISRDGLDGVITDLAGTVLGHRRVAGRGTGVRAVAAGVGRLVDRLTADHPGIVAVGVAVGGRVAEHGMVSAVAGLDWSDVDLLTPLRERVGVPVLLINDVHAYLLAEQWLGAGRGSDAFLVLTVGVGVGCAYAYEGLLLAGDGGTAGRVGHWPLTPDGPCCALGHTGCASGWLSVDRVLARVEDVVGRQVDLEGAVEIARDDPQVADVFRAAARQFGRLVGLVADVVGPSRIVLGGDAISYVRFAEADLREGLAEVRFPGAAPDEVVINPETGFADWARGAAVAALGDWVERVAVS